MYWPQARIRITRIRPSVMIEIIERVEIADLP